MSDSILKRITMIKKLIKIAFMNIYPVNSITKDSVKIIIKKISTQTLARCVLLLLLNIILSILSFLYNLIII